MTPLPRPVPGCLPRQPGDHGQRSLVFGYASPIEDTYIYGRGNWVNITQDPATGAVTFGNPYCRRTPWYTQTDFNFAHSFKVNKNNEHQMLQLSGDHTNLLNQRRRDLVLADLCLVLEPVRIVSGGLGRAAERRDRLRWRSLLPGG